MISASLIGACLNSVQNHRFYRQYWQTFDVMEADTEDLREQIFRLRYDVFCTENDYGFGSNITTDIAGDLEKDSYDERATHYALLHKKTDSIVGTVRFVHPEDEYQSFSLPLQEVCDHPILHDDKLVYQIGEISRLCMARDFRKRMGDGAALPTYYTPEMPGTEHDENVSYYRRNIPYAPLALLGAAFEEALDKGIVNCVTALDPQDLPALRFLGMDYRVLGANLRHYGYMQPIVFNILNFLDQMETNNKGCWEIITRKGMMIKKSHRSVNDICTDVLYNPSVREEILTKYIKG